MQKFFILLVPLSLDCRWSYYWFKRQKKRQYLLMPIWYYFNSVCLIHLFHYIEKAKPNTCPSTRASWKSNESGITNHSKWFAFSSIEWLANSNRSEKQIERREEYIHSCTEYIRIQKLFLCAFVFRTKAKYAAMQTMWVALFFLKCELSTAVRMGDFTLLKYSFSFLFLFL